MRITWLQRMTGMAVIAGLCTFLVGCGGGDRTVQIKGTVLEKGSPIKVAKEKEQANLQFAYKGKDGAAKNAAASLSEDGSFVFDKIPGGVSGTFTLRIMPYPPKGESRDRLGEAFADAGKSPLTYTVTEDGTQEVVIDLAAKQVKKK